jgi:hypothetical protein
MGDRFKEGAQMAGQPGSERIKVTSKAMVQAVGTGWAILKISARLNISRKCSVFYLIDCSRKNG